MGQRHNLEQISVIGEDAKITAAGGVYQGMDRFDARKKIVEDLEAQGLLVEGRSLWQTASDIVSVVRRSSSRCCPRSGS